MSKKASNILFAIFTLVVFTISAKAEDSKAAAKKNDKSFAKHSAEIQLTPSADYLLFQPGNTSIDEPYEGRYPFVGVSVGVQYIFRPIRLLGVSTGVQFRMHGSYSRNKVFPFAGEPYIAQRGNAHLSYVSIPLYIHLYKRMKRSTFEFAIGPDFNIPVFSRFSSTTFSPSGEEVASSKGFNKYSMEAMKEYASFGLSIFLGGVFKLGAHGDIFVGPQIQFLDLARFNTDTRKLEAIDGRFYNAGLGLKLGFRIH